MRYLGFAAGDAQGAGDELERIFDLGVVELAGKKLRRVDDGAQHRRDIAITLAKRFGGFVDDRRRRLVGDESAGQLGGDKLAPSTGGAPVGR